MIFVLVNFAFLQCEAYFHVVIHINYCLVKGDYSYIIVWMCVFSVEDCTAVFSVLETMLEHLWTCDLRSKFMDRSSEQFVCLECGKCFKGEKCTQNHIRKQHPVCLFGCFHFF